MLDEGQNREVRYFSLLESFGGKESALAVSLVYDRGEQNIRYEVHSPGKTYSINKKGQPALYCGKQFVSWKKVEAKKESLNVPKELGVWNFTSNIGDINNGKNVRIDICVRTY